MRIKAKAKLGFDLLFSFFGPLPRVTPNKAILVRSHHLARASYSGQPSRADSIAIDETNILNNKSCQEFLIMVARRNTHPKSYLQISQWLDSFASVDSRKTLPCLGFIEYSPKDQVSLKNTMGSICTPNH